MYIKCLGCHLDNARFNLERSTKPVKITTWREKIFELEQRIMETGAKDLMVDMCPKHFKEYQGHLSHSGPSERVV